MRYPLITFLLLACCLKAQAQALQPGFRKEEYIEMLYMTALQVDSPLKNPIGAPQRHRMIYRAPVTGLDNRWDLWAGDNGSIVFSIRGTTQAAISWLENFYAAMVPARGSLQLSAQHTFDYDLSEDPRAAVHVGWLLGLGSMSSDMKAKLDSCIRSGVKDVVVMGHSQGGGIAYLATAWMRRLQRAGQIPADVRIKTYCSAAPKPGNLYFAYDYERMTAGGWAFNVVNSADWVPETPISVQTLDDFNRTNPFVNARAIIRKQTFPKNIVLRYVYNHMDRPTKKARKRFRKYLGGKAGGFVGKQLREYRQPEYYESNHYVRTGNIIVLYADSAYYRRFPDSRDHIFVHHMMPPYLYLTHQLPE